jgi:hypothetical protein
MSNKTRIVRTVAVAAAGALLVAACGGSGGDDAEGIRIRLGAAPGGNGMAATSEAKRLASSDGAADMAIWAPTEYVLSGELPALDGVTHGWRYAPMTELDAASAARVVAAVGLAGEPTPLGAEMGGGWRLGPDDGSSASVWFSADGLGSWWYQPAWANDTAAGTVPARDCVDTSAVTVEGDAVAPVDPDGTKIAEDCYEGFEPVPPTNVPDEAAARAKSDELLAALGVETSAGLETEVYADDWGAWVTVWQSLDGRRGPAAYSFGFGSEGALTYASGVTQSPEKVEGFERVGTVVGFERLTSGGADWWWGGGAAGYATPASGMARLSADITTEAGDAVVGMPEPMPIDVMPIDENGEPIEPEPVIVEIVDVREDFWTIYDADGALWLVPAYAFLDADGGTYLVPAIGDDVVEQPEADALPEVPAEEPPVELPVSPGDSGEVTEPKESPVSPAVPELVGLPEDEAADVAAAAGLEMRVTERDGEALAATMDYREDRVNVAVDGGVVVRVDGIG